MVSFAQGHFLFRALESRHSILFLPIVPRAEYESKAVLLRNTLRVQGVLRPLLVLRPLWCDSARRQLGESHRLNFDLTRGQMSQLATFPDKHTTTPVKSSSVMNWPFVLLPIGYFWYRLIDSLIPEWSTNAQYSYGWVVPVLCLGLLVRRLQGQTQQSSEFRGSNSEGASPSWCLPLFLSLAFLYLPTRLIQEAIPEWRLVSWALGMEAAGLTLCAVYFHKGRAWLTHLAFPICFFLVAIPWPTFIETPVIQCLTRASWCLAVELLNWAGIPALQHANIIEVATGTIGVDEACSGIRSFQTSLMISLFFGELYLMNTRRRLLLVPIGFALALVFNVCRVAILGRIAAKSGLAAIAEYHDPAGITITIVCVACLWAAAWVLRKPKGQKSKVRPIASGSKDAPSLPTRPSNFISQRVFILLLGWLLFVEVGIAGWYQYREAHITPGPDWTFVPPENNPTLRVIGIDTKIQNLLRFDFGEQVSWDETDGSQWQAFYCNWQPGRVAGYLAKRHTPDVCLPAVGCKLISGPKLKVMTVHGVVFPIRAYVFTDNGGQVLNVFQCRWEAGAATDSFVTDDSASYNLIRGVWAGRGNRGQKVLELVVSGQFDSDQSETELLQHLENLIEVNGAKPVAESGATPPHKS